MFGNDSTEPGYTFYVKLEQIDTTRQIIEVKTNIANGNIVFDSATSAITGNMVALPILDG